jgi:hypothetical protein
MGDLRHLLHSVPDCFPSLWMGDRNRYQTINYSGPTVGPLVPGGGIYFYHFTPLAVSIIVTTGSLPATATQVIPSRWIELVYVSSANDFWKDGSS